MKQPEGINASENSAQKIMSKGVGEQEEKIYTPSESMKELKAMRKKMGALCKDLFEEAKVFDAGQWLHELDCYLKASSSRLLYSSISDSVFVSTENFSFMSNNLESVIDYFECQGESEIFETNRNELKAVLIKFYDHANLAYRQSLVFRQTKQDIEGIVDQHLDNKTSQLTKDLTSQLVGLVAIFTALSFIVFGAMSSLDSTLDALAENVGAVLPTLIVIIGWAFCIMNLLFAFMYFVLRIIKIPTASDSRNLVQKYPLVFLCNFVLLVAVAVCIGSWAAIQTGVGKKFYDCALEHGTMTFIVGIGVIAALAYFLGRKLWKLYRYPEIRCETRNNPEE